MCGRFSFSTTKTKIKEQFDINSEQELEFSFNIAPTHLSYVIANDHPKR